MKVWHIVIVVGVFGLLSLFYKGLGADPKKIPTVLVGTEAPAFAGPDVPSGTLMSSQSLQGKVVVMNFWASWCRECRLEHDNLLAINRQFRHDQNFVMVGINYQDKEDDARRYLEVYGREFDHLRDVSGTIAIDYGVYGVPETFVIDQKGIIRYKQIGPILGDVYTRLTDGIIQPLLDGKALQTL